MMSLTGPPSDSAARQPPFWRQERCRNRCPVRCEEMETTIAGDLRARGHQRNPSEHSSSIESRSKTHPSITQITTPYKRN
jgi:hypothetical protein